MKKSRTNRCVMLALVSDQPLPNIMAVLQYDPPPDHVEFVVSADKSDVTQYDPWYNAKYHALCRAIQHLEISCSRMLPVHPYRMQDVKEQCLAAVAKHSEADHIVLNVTGGTKLMALAAYLAGLESGRPVVYVESRDRRLIVVSGSTSDERAFDEARFKQISVKQYLTAYNRIVEKETRHKTLSEQNVSTAHSFVENLPASWALLRAITKAVREQGGRKVPRHFTLESLPAPQQEVLEQLVADDYLSPFDQPNQFVIASEDKWHFLQGVWLEVYAFDTLYRSGYFDDVCGNVQLKGAPGELDVVLTHNASLAICEAKFGAKLSITMSHLRALKDTLAGVYGRIFYVTAQDKVTKDMANLARVYGVTDVITGPKLPRIAELIREHM